MNWISVKDGLPPVGEEVLVLDEEDGYMTAKINKDGIWIKYFPSMVYEIEPKPTHWMPLPSPPKEKECCKKP